MIILSNNLGNVIQKPQSSKGSILVTGCTGLLGSNLCYLLKDEYRVVGTSRSPLEMTGVEWVKGDISDPDFDKAVMAGDHFDAVVHCAALTNVDRCEEEPDLAMQMNRDASIRLAQAAVSDGAKFVFISTDAVFSGDKSSPYTEVDLVDPVNVYGLSKVQAEEAVLLLDDALVLRTNMHGFNYLDKTSFSEWILSALRREERLRMFDDVRFSALFVNDLVNGIRKAIEADLSGLYHLASRDSMTKYEFGLSLAKVAGLQGEIEPVSVDDMSFVAQRSKNMALDSRKLSAALDVMMPSMQEGIVRYVTLEQEGYPAMLKGTDRS